ncbi:protein TIFY 5A-like [Solanum lycopersicum]|uniref:Protein TIFY n=2 Tax=Solanum subgen. Lycopersicon TaxID=49274 RepID=A0A3Q7HKH2_SOLLC|nr:protein TIFY 5A-like [Solanum lycopersicum]XP_015084702.1 protein TIFY 5A-like [Solanum pennellii]
MRRNCNLELTLMPPSISDNFSSKNCTTEDQQLENKQSQQLTIFYHGKFVVSDATELQAKAIIYLASRGMEMKTNKMSEPSSPLLQPQTVKKSLQGFLQKRKKRVQATSPYHK